MQPGQAEFNKKFYETVRQAIPPQLKILYICLIGSQGKNLASPESDYDIRVIFVGPFDLYLLQRPSEKVRIDTTFEGTTLEGTGVDVNNIFNYALDSNPFIIDVLRGIPVYKESDKLIGDLRRIFIEGYLPLVPMNAFQGILYSMIKRELKDTKGEYLVKAPAKVVVECIFVTLQLRCLFTDKSIIDYFAIDKLMEFAGGEEEYMKSLVAIRRNNKKEEIPVTEDFKKILDDILDKTQEFVKNFPQKEKEKVNAKRTELRKVVDKMCLEVIYANKDSSQS